MRLVNEDYVIGSVELASISGAEVWHADSQWNYRYGNPVLDGQEWRLGHLKIKAILSPGHTPGMMSYLLHDDADAPWVLFSGDALFAGDVGRVDFMGSDRLDEMATLLYGTPLRKALAVRRRGNRLPGPRLGLRVRTGDQRQSLDHHRP